MKIQTKAKLYTAGIVLLILIGLMLPIGLIQVLGYYFPANVTANAIYQDFTIGGIIAQWFIGAIMLGIIFLIGYIVYKFGDYGVKFIKKNKTIIFLIIPVLIILIIYLLLGHA